MTGTTTAQYSLSIAMTSVGERVSLNVVKPARSAKRTLTSRSSPPSRSPRRRAADGSPGRRPRQVRPERRVQAAQLAGGLREQGESSSVAPSRRRSGEHPVGRLAPRPRPPRPRRSPPRASDRSGRASPRGTARRTPRPATRSGGTRWRAPSAMAANAASISRCHSHQLSVPVAAERRPRPSPRPGGERDGDG